MAATGNELLRLSKELDFTNAAATELDIVAFDRDLAVPTIRMNLTLHFVHVGDGREVEILSPDEGRQIVQQPLAGREIAGAGARLDERRALPVLTAAFVIIERRRRRYRDLGRRRIGPQTQIDAEDVTVRGALLDQLHQFARQADVKWRRFGFRRQRGSLRIEEHHQIDIARVVELKCPHFAHGEHDVA